MTSSTTQIAGRPRKVSRPLRTPGATYRLQFSAKFTFNDAAAVASYLQRLGITDVYASPLLTASPGSTHGYDTCCASEISPALGGESAFQSFSSALAKSRLGLLLDIVPNHMGACAVNNWWWDVLKHGPRSEFACFFDIAWQSGNPALAGKVLLPVLGRRIPDVLASGEIRIIRVGDEPRLAYYENQFPISPQTPVEWITRVEEAQRMDDHALCVDSLAALLDAQHYRLAWWRVGPEEINYRRFFDVTDLVAMRMEDPRVFDAAHSKFADLIRSGVVTGFRVDHPDGLRDPEQYFARLQALRPDQPVYVVAEKILSDNESLPADWAVQGTTGYDFLNQLNGLFVSHDSEQAFDLLYQEFTGSGESYADLAYNAKKRILELSFIADVDALASQLHQIAATLLAGRDLTLRQLRSAIVELIAGLPVYRTYLREGAVALSARDAGALEHAAGEARRRAPAQVHAIDFLVSLLALRAGAALEQRSACLEFILRFQQLSGPAAAKGIEDTAFYNYLRFVSLNEVGGEPGHFGVSLEKFHAANLERSVYWPHSLLATSTHDTKRGEDVRARLNVLSEMPATWRVAVLRWRDCNRIHKNVAAVAEMPDSRDEYLLYQTIVGAWDEQSGLDQFRRRISAYMLKASREAKRNTSWIEPDEEYENALGGFVQKVLDPTLNEDFLTDVRDFAADVAYFGRFNSLAQTLLKLAAPGVPDLYQGAELWDLSLVDPDNRRPVDFALRENLLTRLLKTAPTSSQMGELFTDPHGAAKLWLISRALRCRNMHRELFDRGEYIPLQVRGEPHLHRHVCAFARVLHDRAAIAVAPRFVRTLVSGIRMYPSSSVWGNSEVVLPERFQSRRFHNVITGMNVDASSGALRVGELFASLPAALLVCDGL